MGQNIDEARKVNELAIQLAQLWVVAQCKCVPTKMYHSESHLDCFSVDPWLIDEFKNCARNFSQKINDEKKAEQSNGIPKVRINSTESLQIEIDSLCSTARKKPHSFRKM